MSDNPHTDLDLMAGLTKEREAKLKEAREGIESIQKWVKAILDVIDLTPDEDGAS